MKHFKRGRKLHRERDQRRALLKSLGSNLILKESIITTESKAKETRSFIEKKITIAKKGDLAAIRSLRKHFSQEVIKKLLKEIAPLFKERKGGYTRIIKMPPRETDGTKMAKIELIK